MKGPAGLFFLARLPILDRCLLFANTMSQNMMLMLFTMACCCLLGRIQKNTVKNMKVTLPCLWKLNSFFRWHFFLGICHWICRTGVFGIVWCFCEPRCNLNCRCLDPKGLHWSNCGCHASLLVLCHDHEERRKCSSEDGGGGTQAV